MAKTGYLIYIGDYLTVPTFYIFFFLHYHTSLSWQSLLFSLTLD